MLFREGDSEVLDAVFYAESLKEDNEVPEVLDEVVVAFVGLDVAQEDYVVGRLSMWCALWVNMVLTRERSWLYLSRWLA